AAAGIDDVAIGAVGESRADERRLLRLAQRPVAPSEAGTGGCDRGRNAGVATGGGGPYHADGRDRRHVPRQVGQQVPNAARLACIVDWVPRARGPEAHRAAGSLMKLDAPAAAVDDE